MPSGTANLSSGIPEVEKRWRVDNSNCCLVTLGNLTMQRYCVFGPRLPLQDVMQHKKLRITYLSKVLST